MRIPTLLTALILSAPLYAQSAAPVTPQPNDLIEPRTAAYRILVPAAGNTAGANGTYFRSDINVINLKNSSSQVVQLRWLPQAGTGTSGTQIVTIAAQSGISSENFIGEILGRTGLGALEVTGLTAGGALDTTAQLQVTSRIWTPEPDNKNGIDDEGTMSQTFPSIVLPSNASSVKGVFGVRRSPQYRLNVGITNPTGVTQHFKVTTYVLSNPVDITSFNVDLPAQTMNQFNIGGTTTGLVQVIIQNTEAATGDWQAWASSVDNESGDAWSQMAVNGSEP
jgi:hypothetical protein